MELASYIEELLYENDCVILPTIGGFIVNPTTAQIDFVEQQLCPPSKTVSFNPKLVSNDGLLAHYISQKQHITYKQAQEHIEGYTRQIEQDLFNNKIVDFEHIGKLYFNSDSKLEFVPAATNFMRSAYGLPTIACKPVLRNKDYLQQSASTASIQRHPKRKGAALFTPARIAVVAAAVLLLISIPLWQETLFSNAQTAADVTQGEPTSDVHQSKVVSASVLPDAPTPTDQAATTNTTTTTDNLPVLETKDDASILPVVLPKEEHTEDYVIVLGAFGKEKNAYRLANKLAKDNYLPDVTIKNGLNRVGVQLNCTPEELQEHLAFLQKNYNKKAWIVE